MRRKSAALLALSLFVVLAGCTRRRDDIVLVAVDSFRADRLHRSYAAGTLAPALDSLAVRGVEFGEARTPAPTLREAALAVLGADSKSPTLAATLARKGYTTAAAVASSEIGRGSGADAGFEAFDDTMSAVYPIVDPSYADLQDEMNGRERRADATVIAALRLAQKASPKKPLFLFVHLADPEQPYDPPLPFASEHSDFAYDGEIAFVDAAVSHLVSGMETLRERRPVVVFTGLFGEGLGAHEEMTHGFFLYDTTLRVPLFVSGPGIPIGRKEAGAVSIADVAATVAAIARVPLGRGRDLTPAFRGKPVPPEPLVATTFYPKKTHRWSALAAAVDDGWKLIRAPKPELYHLAEDPGENVNRFGREREAEQRLSAILDASGPPADSLFAGAAGESLPDPKDRLASWNRSQTALLHLRHGRIYEDSGDEKRALAEFDLADSLAPELPDVHVHRGYALMLLERNAEAREAFRRALELDDRFAPAWSALGTLEEKSGHTDEARAAFTRAFEEARGNSSVLLNVMSFDLREGDLAGAIKAGEALVAARPRDVTALNDLATLYLSAGKAEESLAACQRALLADPGQPVTHYNMGRALVAAGRPGDAARAFERYLEILPDAPNAEAVRKGIDELKRRAEKTAGKPS